MQLAQSTQEDLGQVLLSDPTDGSFAAAQEEGHTDFFAWIKGLFQRRASSRSLLLAFRQLSLLVETGIDVSEALELVASGCKHAALRESLETIFDDINNGNSLGRAVQAQEQVLGKEVAASIQAGEASGRLVDVLRQISSQLEEELQVRSSIVGALAYPAILSLASLGVAAILIWFVLPQFESSFSSMGVEPPALTEALLTGARLLRENVLVAALGVGGTIVLGTVAMFQPAARQVLHRICFASPIIGPALRNMAVGRLFVSLGHLLKNGISLLEAIQLIRRSNSAGAIGGLTAAWEKDVLEGRGLTHQIDQFSFLPEGADAMLIMAERTGKLDSVLSTAGEFYRNEGSTQLKTVLKLSEPLIIILLGAFVGMVVASVLLPILDVQSAGSVQ